MRLRIPSAQTRAILDELLSRPSEWRYGYDLAKLVGLSSGTLYPILMRLHDRGLLDAEWIASDRPGRPARHAYRLSAAGMSHARQLREGPSPLVPHRPEALA